MRSRRISTRSSCRRRGCSELLFNFAVPRDGDVSVIHAGLVNFSTSAKLHITVSEQSRRGLMSIRYLALVGLLTAGCVSMIDPITYVPPEASPRAKLRIVADQDSPTHVSTFPTPDCHSKPQKIASLGRHLIPDLGYGRRIGIPMGDSYNPKVMTELYVPAGKPFPMMFYSFSGSNISTSSCITQAAFDPQDGGLYEAVFVLTREDCRLQIYKIEVDGIGRNFTAPERSARRLEACTYRNQ